MYAALEQSLDVLLPHLTPALAQPDAVLDLKSLANHLAPIWQGGFECRLRRHAPQIDLQQRLVPDDGELRLLQALVAEAAAAEGDTSSSWSRLQDFLAVWAEPTSLLHQQIPEIWLEFDVDAPASGLSLPAVFVGLPQEISPAVDAYETAAQALHRLLGQAGWSDWQDALYRCFAACPDGVFVSHIGVMLSRHAPALRVNVKRLQPDSLMPYLQRIGWPGDLDDVTTLMRQLLAFADRITACLDVGRHVYPPMGFECIFLKQPPCEPRWAHFLNHLVQLGLCEPEKREALLNWPGQTTPMNALAPWPNHLIAASLLQPSESFTVFDRQLSHIKVAWHPQHTPEAKAYLWFQHQWRA